MSHLETLIAEYYGWNNYLVHIEPLIDAHSWNLRQDRFAKKFGAARKYIFSEIFTWLDQKTKIEQIAVLISHPKGRDSLAGGTLISIDEFVSKVRREVAERGVVARNAIPEQYPLLRTIQLVENGYYKTIPAGAAQ